MKIMMRKDQAGIITVYVPKKDLEEPVVSMEKEEMWGGIVTLANGWQLELPPPSDATVMPCTVEVRKLNED
jgi:nitrogen fixation protein NifT